MRDKAKNKYIDETYDDLETKYKKIYLGALGESIVDEAKTALDIAAEADAKARAQAAAQMAVRAMAEARSRAGKTFSSAGPAGAPFDHHDNIACVDMSELKLDYDSNDSPKIYYHDRYPSIPAHSIIDDAIALLDKNKKLYISKISFSHIHPDFRLVIVSNHPYDSGLRKTLEVVINHKAFDRAYKTELDDYAGLMAKLDTNTYIKLRIAFLLYEALKLRDEDARKISLDLFKIMGSYTRPNFSF